MEEKRLGLKKTNFIRVVWHDTAGKFRVAYGGDQNWFAETAPSLKAHGCGLIALVNVMYYIEGKARVERTEYMERVLRIYKDPAVKFQFNVLKTGFFVTTMVRYGIKALDKRLPDGHMRWNMKPDRFLLMKEMLSNDIPVILQIDNDKTGRKIGLFADPGLSKKRGKINNHYITVTGLIESESSDGKERTVMEVSNWGRRDYIDYKEYADFIKAGYEKPLGKAVSNAVNNILYISP